MGDALMTAGTSWSESETTIAASDRAVRVVQVGGDARRALSDRDLYSSKPVLIRLTATDAWAEGVWSRVAELSALPRGWDSYGALPIQRAAVVSLRDSLDAVRSSVNSAPSISMSTDGGLICEWDGPEQAVTLNIDGMGVVSVHHEDMTSGSEWEGPFDEVEDLEKKVWHSSI